VTPGAGAVTPGAGAAAAEDPAGALAALGSLPGWLAAGMDADRVAASLAGNVTGLADGRCRLLACTPERLRVTDDGWRARYRVTVTGPDGRARETLLVGTLRPPTDGRPPAGAPGPERAPTDWEPGWQCGLPDLGLALRAQDGDNTLPGLVTLLDPAAVTRLLGPVLHDAGYRDATVTACRLRVVRHRPGTRCTVRADLDYAPEAGGPAPPGTVVLKTHADDRGATAWAAMSELWRRRRSWREAVLLAEPLAYLPGDRILVQGPVPGGSTLKDLVRRAAADGGSGLGGRLRQRLDATARGLAALHTSHASYPRVVTFADELAATGDLAARLSAASVPQVAAAVAPLLRRLTEASRARPPDPPVPCHHDFRPGQVLVHGQNVGFVDFDKACMAEPAVDLAAFRASLRDTGIAAMCTGGRPAPAGRLDADLARLDDWCEHFLAEYRRHAPVSAERVRLWETLHLLTALVHAWAKVRPARLQPRLTLLLHDLGADATGRAPARPGLARQGLPSASM
jgi:Phosphotransferase enzyme family